MSDYTTVGGDSLPQIAELFGHPGEWQAIVELNADVWSDYHNVQPGLELTLPADWIHEPEEEPPSEEEPPTRDYTGWTATQLADEADAANTLAELDAIGAAANGRITFSNAVNNRRSELLAAGATQ
jgi:hypothetical protein